MAWSIALKHDKFAFEIDGGSANLLLWLNNDPPVAGARLCLSLKPLLDMSDDDILDIVRWFKEYGYEVGIINDAEEAHYDEQFVSDEDLKTIIHSHLASDNQKQAARQVQHERRYGKREIIGTVEPKESKLPRPGYVYLAYSETDHYKIGKSVGPEDRIAVFDTQMPVEVSMLHTFEADDMSTAEARLHQQFDDKRVKGEWFELAPVDIEFIKSIEVFAGGQFVGAYDGE